MIIIPGYVCCGPSEVNSFPHYVLGTQEAADLKITEGERVLVTDRTSDDWWVFFYFSSIFFCSSSSFLLSPLTNVPSSHQRPFVGDVIA